MKKTKMIIFKTSILFMLSLASKYGYTNAIADIILENNCTSPVNFTIKSDNSRETLSKTINPNEYYLAGRYTNKNTFTHKTSKMEVSFSNKIKSGSLLFYLNNGFLKNKAIFKKIYGNIAVEHNSLKTDYIKTWHSYTLSGKYDVPTFTITSCKDSLNIKRSILKNIDRVMIFGDSLSDQGNLYSFLGGIIPKSTPYYSGMFSNGNPWSVIFQNTIKQYNIKLSNYAVGGATVLFEPSWADVGLPYDLNSQVNVYQINRKLWPSNEKRLAIFFIGANDYLTAKKSMTIKQIKKAANKVVDNIKSSVEKVNAKKTIIIGLPNLSLTPESNEIGNEEVLKKLSSIHNKLLSEYAKKSENVQFIDINNLFESALKDPIEFNRMYGTHLDPNLINESCWRGGYTIQRSNNNNELYNTILMKKISSKSNLNILNKVRLSADIKATILASESGYMCKDPWHYIFWDHVHPTYQIHKALYKYIMQKIGAKTLKTKN